MSNLVTDETNFDMATYFVKWEWEVNYLGNRLGEGFVSKKDGEH